MCFQITCPNWCKVTLVALMRFFSRVDFQMCPQIACLNRGKVILFAFMRLFFFRISFQKCLQMPARTYAKLHWLHCAISFQCGFSYVFSRPLKLQMQNHIGCIYAIFSEWISQCIFRLLAWRDAKLHQSYNCMIFLQSVFSNVPSKHLPELMHSRIGCTCTIFIQSAFTNVPSNPLPHLMHSHIGYIWTNFLQRGFSYVYYRMSPQKTWMNRCRFTLHYAAIPM